VGFVKIIPGLTPHVFVLGAFATLLISVVQGKTVTAGAIFCETAAIWAYPSIFWVVSIFRVPPATRTHALASDVCTVNGTPVKDALDASKLDRVTVVARALFLNVT
jgi:hypothetical protein